MLCSSHAEIKDHLFTTCPVAVTVWTEIYNWLGLQTVFSGNLSSSFDTFAFPFTCKKHGKDSFRYGKRLLGRFGLREMRFFFIIRSQLCTTFWRQLIIASKMSCTIDQLSAQICNGSLLKGSLVFVMGMNGLDFP
jgi:hypothetical protein